MSRFTTPRTVAAGLLWCLLPIGALAQTSPVDPVREQLRRRLEHPSRDRSLQVEGETIHSSTVLPSFYERRLYRPAWISGSGPSAAASDLLAAVRDSFSHGLVPSHYHLVALEELMGSAARLPAPLADLDILLTDAFLILGAHLVSGRVDPESFDADWVAVRREVDLAAALERALAGGKPRAALDDLLPDHPGYARLRDGLRRYRDLAVRGWPSVASGPSLHPGDRDPRVGLLRARIRATDDGMAPLADGADDLYDEDLATAVRRFQGRHGLEPDGVVGEKTLAALNVPAGERVRQIELNLERWRWLPQDLGSRYVLVNIPDFSLVMVDGGETILEMRAAVGRSYRRTPVFSDTIRYLVLNPSWDVPHRLAVQDKLPEIQKDPSYFAKQGFRVFQGQGSEQRQVDPAGVDWSQVSRDRFPYHLRQSPGPLNALGRVKFMFPNRFNVYLHDTPTREVFRSPERDVSSGCIRLENPLGLAELLLASSPRWSREAIEAAIATGRESTVSLERPLPVHVLYWTAWADDDGSVHFRRDVYGRDELLAQALERAASAGVATPPR